MLSKVLLIHVLRASAFVVGAVALAVTFLLGPDAGIGVLVGGALMVLDGAALVFLVGRLLDPALAGSVKGLFVGLLIGKLSIVAGLLWMSLSVWGVHGLGLLIGLGIGLTSLVLGLQRGSTSPEAVDAMRAAEEAIEQEMGDNDDEMR